LTIFLMGLCTSSLGGGSQNVYLDHIQFSGKYMMPGENQAQEVWCQYSIADEVSYIHNEMDKVFSDIDLKNVVGPPEFKFLATSTGTPVAFTLGKNQEICMHVKRTIEKYITPERRFVEKNINIVILPHTFLSNRMSAAIAEMTKRARSTYEVTYQKKITYRNYEEAFKAQPTRQVVSRVRNTGFPLAGRGGFNWTGLTYDDIKRDVRFRGSTNPPISFPKNQGSLTVSNPLSVPDNSETYYDNIPSQDFLKYFPIPITDPDLPEQDLLEDDPFLSILNSTTQPTIDNPNILKYGDDDNLVKEASNVKIAGFDDIDFNDF
jgi:hypothetical protein